MFYVFHTFMMTATSEERASGSGTTPAPRKRKAKTSVSHLMTSFMDMQNKQHTEFMEAEQQRQAQEQQSLGAWMNSQVEVYEG